MLKSYASKVWPSMKFHFIGRCPWEWSKGIPEHLLSDGSQALSQTFSQPGSPVAQLEFPGIRHLQSGHVCFLGITHISGRLLTSAALVLADLMGLWKLQEPPPLSWLCIDSHKGPSLALSVSPLLLLESGWCYVVRCPRRHLSVFYGIQPP